MVDLDRYRIGEAIRTGNYLRNRSCLEIHIALQSKFLFFEVSRTGNYGFAVRWNSKESNRSTRLSSILAETQQVAVIGKTVQVL